MSSKKIYRLNTDSWSIERLMFLVAGTFVIICTLLGFTIHTAFHFATLFVGSMLMFFSITRYCPMAILLDRITKGSLNIQKETPEEVPSKQ